MLTAIDLPRFFSVEAIEEAFWTYKAQRTDRYKTHIVRIAMGADGITWHDFESNLHRNAINISRRVLNGSYQFYPLRQVKVPKDETKPDGDQRPLVVASIRDALTQVQLYRALYDSAEIYLSDARVNHLTFAYRKHKSAPHAAQRLWSSYKKDGYAFAFDADIRGFFDHLNHDRMLEFIDTWVGLETHPGTLLRRYLRTDIVPWESYPHPKEDPNWRKYFQKNKGVRRRRWDDPMDNPEGTPQGVPQGGVLSGMLANLYLHEFDLWVITELRGSFPLRFYRYADDFVILTKSDEHARAAWEPVREKLALLHLELHPTKTRVVSIPRDGLDFLGFTFGADKVAARQKNIDGFRMRFLKALRRERLFNYRRPRLHKRLRNAIKYCVNPKILGPEPLPCPTCHLPMDRRRNWMAYFSSVVTDVDQLKQLDRWMRKQVCRYFRDSYRVRVGVKDLRRVGMRSLVHEYYRQHETNSPRCNCPSGLDNTGASTP